MRSVSTAFGFFVVLALCAALASPRTVSAQSAAPAAPAAEDRTEEAKALFSAGRAAFDAGHYQDALDYFERSYAISQRSGLLYNIALTNDRLRNDEAALKAYDAYLKALPAAENAEEARVRAAAIRDALARRNGAATPAPAPAPSPATATATTPPPSAAAIPAPAAATAPSRPTAPAQATSDSVLSKWWFWTLVGTVVASGVTIGVVVASDTDAPAKAPEPKSGLVVTTLGAAP